MSRWRLLLAVLAGILAGFFLCLVALDVRPSSPQVPRDDVTAASVSASAMESAEYGEKQAAVHTALVTRPPIVPFIRVLSETKKSNAACPCPAVFQLQRALKAAKVRGAASKATGIYGSATTTEVKAFQKRVKIAQSGVYGEKTHKALSKFYDLEGRQRLQQVAHTRTVLRFQAKIVEGAAFAWKNRMSMAYSQGASRAFIPTPLPAFPRSTDCSGYATWLFKLSGLPDPNGFAYSPVGYTGTLAQHGTRVSANGLLRVGDLVFYGGGWPYGHVAIVVDGFKRLVSSHGSPGIKVLPFNYRPVSAIRRYF